MATQSCEWDGSKVQDVKCREMKNHRKSMPNFNHTNLEDTNLPKRQILSDLVPTINSPSCSLACSERTTCQNCTKHLCMWCKNLAMCVDRNAYLASFPYGQCMDWTTKTEECPIELSPEDNSTSTTDPDQICSGYKTCESCRANPSCGWCDDGLGTGIGGCMIGGASGPLVKVRSGHSQVQWVAADICPVEQGKSWHFTSCPGKKSPSNFNFHTCKFAQFQIFCKAQKNINVPLLDFCPQLSRIS